MSLREQIEALDPAPIGEKWVPMDAVLDIIDQHECYDRDALARALHEAGVGCVYGPGGRLACGPLDDHLPRPFHESQANHIIAALEKA